MSEFNSGSRLKAWGVYSGGSSPPPSQTYINNEEVPSWKSSFGTSMSALSFGFVATAILISMFLIMAIFEHLFRPTESHDQSSSSRMEVRQVQKLRNPEMVQALYASDFSVVMPGQQYPTFIAQPAPLPCPREGMHRGHTPT